MTGIAWKSSYFGKRIPDMTLIINTFWTHTGVMVAVVYDSKGDLKELQHNGEESE